MGGYKGCSESQLPAQGRDHTVGLIQERSCCPTSVCYYFVLISEEAGSSAAPNSIFRVGKAAVDWLGAMEQEEAVMSLSLLSCSLVLLWLFHLPANKTNPPKVLERLM